MACNTVLFSGGLGILGTAVGAFLGHYLSKTWQREQWLLDNKKQECREVLTALSKACLACVDLNAMRATSGLIEGAYEKEVESIMAESYRVLRDRLFIAEDIKRTGVLDGWLNATKAFEHNRDFAEFRRRYNEINNKLVGLVVRPPTP